MHLKKNDVNRKSETIIKFNLSSTKINLKLRFFFVIG
jgi:hypothetical protein